MENSSSLDQYDWFHSIDAENKIVYVKYMNLSVFESLSKEFSLYKIHYSSFKLLDSRKYSQVIENFLES